MEAANTWLWYMDIYISSNLDALTKFSSSNSRSTKFKHILLQNISKMITKT